MVKIYRKSATFTEKSVQKSELFMWPYDKLL